DRLRRPAYRRRARARGPLVGALRHRADRRRRRFLRPRRRFAARPAARVAGARGARRGAGARRALRRADGGQDGQDGRRRARSRQPRGPYALAGLSFGGVVAFEMARRLRTLGHDVSLLALFDSPVAEQLPKTMRDDAELLYYMGGDDPELLPERLRALDAGAQ